MVELWLWWNIPRYSFCVFSLIFVHYLGSIYSLLVNDVQHRHRNGIRYQLWTCLPALVTFADTQDTEIVLFGFGQKTKRCHFSFFAFTLFSRPHSAAYRTDVCSDKKQTLLLGYFARTKKLWCDKYFQYTVSDYGFVSLLSLSSLRQRYCFDCRLNSRNIIKLMLIFSSFAGPISHFNYTGENNLFLAIESFYWCL